MIYSCIYVYIYIFLYDEVMLRLRYLYQVLAHRIGLVPIRADPDKLVRISALYACMCVSVGMHRYEYLYVCMYVCKHACFQTY